MNHELYDRARIAATVIGDRLGSVPTTAVILGSGLSGFTAALDSPVALDYAEIPGFPRPSVTGHAGRLVVGEVGGQPIAALAGRFHYYEGHDLPAVTFPVRVLQQLGVRTLILTAAVGGIRAGLGAGSLVCLSDHINLIGSNPLRGPNDDRLGERFPDMSRVYDRTLRRYAHDAAAELGIELHEGVYAAVPGPSYETPAEVRMLRLLGADVVGMSTVPEAIVARHAGMRVLGLVLVTNPAAGLSEATISHHEVIDAGRAAGPRLVSLIRAIVARIEP